VRAQTSLPAVGIAFLLLTGTLVVGVLAAEAALRGADRQALDRRAAVGLSETLVRADAPVTERQNVVNESVLADLTAADLRNRYGLPPDASVRLGLDGQTLVSEGSPAGGVTVERTVLVVRSEQRTIHPSLEGTRTVTVPRRTASLELTLRPPVNTTLQSVRVNGRVRLHNTSGLNGTYGLPVTTVETARLHFKAVGPLSEDTVVVRYEPVRTEKGRLVVTVDG
jgi:hypothetical protein